MNEIPAGVSEGSYDELAFKPAPGGFVFRAAGLWPFVPAKHYLVSSEQKAAILDQLARARGKFFTTAILAVSLAVVAADALAAPIPGYLFLLLMAPDLWLASVHHRSQAVRPLIASLTPSQDRITLREWCAAYAAVGSWVIVLWTIAFAVFTVEYSPIGFDRLHAWNRSILDPGTLVAWSLTAVCACATAFLLYITILKLRRSERR
jgi:hypothetical protein